jgi:hypothetical protein
MSNRRVVHTGIVVTIGLYTLFAATAQAQMGYPLVCRSGGGMQLSWSGFVGACIPAASAVMRPALPQSGDLVPFDAGCLEAAAFIDDSLQAVRQDAATESDRQAPPIFGRETEPVAGEVAAKWRAVEADIDREQQVWARCREQEACSVVAQNLLDIVAEGAGRSGLARVGLINRAVDLAITPGGDEAQWGVADH